MELIEWRIGREKAFILLSLCASIFTTLAFISCDSNVEPGAYDTAIGGGPCRNNSFNASQCSTATSQYVTTTVGGSVTGSNGSLSATIPLGYYTGGDTCAMLDSLLISGNILSGISIFGVAGTLGFQSLMGSSAFRTVGINPATLASEINQGTCSNNTSTTRTWCEAASGTWTPSLLPAGYDEFAVIANDDDGTNASSPVVSATHPNPGDCGSTQKTIAARIANCSQSWDASTNGNTGEATWKLVTRMSGYEVWQDQKTGFLWSDDTDYSHFNANWCWASGNQGPDPSNICTNAGNQNQVTPYSFCTEVDNIGTPLSSAITAKGYGSGENYATGVYDPTKGGMGKIPSSTSPSVLWRLPTVNDFKQANANGIRHVLPQHGAPNSYNWTATVISSNRAQALQWNYYNYILNSTRSTSSSGVLCIGR